MRTSRLGLQPSGKNHFLLITTAQILDQLSVARSSYAELVNPVTGDAHFLLLFDQMIHRADIFQFGQGDVSDHIHIGYDPVGMAILRHTGQAVLDSGLRGVDVNPGPIDIDLTTLQGLDPPQCPAQLRFAGA